MTRGSGITTVVLAGSMLSAGCRETPVARRGPPQVRVIARSYPLPIATLRAKVLDRFTASRASLPEPFRHMTASALVPPSYSADWLEGFVDPGGYLVDYKRKPAVERTQDLLLEDATGERYWRSEYLAGTTPAQFRCGLVLHFAARPPSSTEVSIYEFVPTVWAGEHWAFSKHGVGFGRYRDLRFVEPTVTERVETLALLDRIVAE